MAYTDGETAILNRIRAHADYSSSNAVKNNWQVLDSGKSAFYAILRPHTEPAEIKFYSFGGYHIGWNAVIEVWQRYKDDGVTAADLFGNVQTILAQMQPYKQLGRTDVQNAEITGITAPTHQWTKDGGMSWLKQELIITWLEEVEVSAFV